MEKKKQRASAKKAVREKQPEVRAFLMGASPDSTPEHTRQIIQQLRLDPALDLVIGVDGGVQAWMDAGVKPHMAMGDWDSFTGAKARKLLSTIHHQTLPVDKDRSDFFYAVCSALAAGATQIIALGVTGGRSDQHLAALLDLTRIAAGEAGEPTRVSAYGPDAEYHFLSPVIRHWKDTFAHPRTLSIFALHGAARGVTLKGLKYAMKSGTIEPSSHGLSNRTWATSCEVSLTEGNLLVLIPAEKYTSSNHGA